MLRAANQNRESHANVHTCGPHLPASILTADLELRPSLRDFPRPLRPSLATRNPPIPPPPEQSEHQDTTSLLLRIHAIPDVLLFPFSSSDPPSPAGAHLRSGVAHSAVTSVFGPKEANSQDTIRPAYSNFQTSNRHHARSYTVHDKPSNSVPEIAIWVSLSPCRENMNITLFEGWRIVVQVPLGDWESQFYTSDDVKRAALICMGRQLLGEKIICVPIDVRWDFDAVDSGRGEDHRSTPSGDATRRTRAEEAAAHDGEVRPRQQLGEFARSDDSIHSDSEEDENENDENEPPFRSSIDSTASSQIAIHTRRPTAPEPHTPDASSAENGHSPLASSKACASQQDHHLPLPLHPPPSSSGSGFFGRSAWSGSFANTTKTGSSSKDSVQDFVTALDHEDPDLDAIPYENEYENEREGAVPPSPPSSRHRSSPSSGAVHPTQRRRTSWIRAHFPRLKARRILPKLNGAIGKFFKWALGRRRL
ncbi:hypothetical protein FRB90_000482 [Tulasnella sp. 427]|nr:hypothetical protein FRB90_000482 [Tulasnella sp. 427]